MKIKTGKYKHFKGGEYEVVGSARHSETLEEFVVYKDVKGKLWVRPLKMFTEEVEANGQKALRFKYIEK